jgi:lipid-binding SYLF domain-containing protein
MTMIQPTRIFLATAALLLINGCTSIPVEQRSDKRAELNRVAEETIEMMIGENPELQQSINDSAGYFVAKVSAANVAVIGGGQGIGVLVDRQSGERSYLNVKRFDLGAGLGVRYYRALVIIETPEVLEDIRRGRSFKAAGADITAGTAGTAGAASIGKGVSLHLMEESGASLAATARLVSLRVNSDLTDTGLSEISIPNIGFGIEDGREETERRWWDHKMPFMAQKVIDKGYDLPLPYGLKVSYVNVDQDQLPQSINDTYQAIFDTWVFPFMNVFAFLGKIDGHAPLDVIVDGNGWLDALDIDCSKPGNLVPCGLLQDQEFVLPIDAKFTGNNYGIGINLAGGWNGFFVTLPITYVYADMDDSHTDGAVFQASPRVGKSFNLKHRGNLAIYVGGSYLKSDLTVSGTVTVPDTDFQLDYQMDQQNKDEWAAIVGANWDVNRHWSIQAEYNGFVGSRETWMGSVTWRF